VVEGDEFTVTVGMAEEEDPKMEVMTRETDS
jgi:hypothetical protein